MFIIAFFFLFFFLSRWEDRSPLSYTKWSRGEPNNWGLNEDCVYLSSITGRWFDSWCSYQLPFICKLGKHIFFYQNDCLFYQTVKKDAVSQIRNKLPCAQTNPRQIKAAVLSTNQMQRQTET